MRIPSLLVTPAPSIAVEIAARRVAAVALSTQGRAPVVSAYASEELPAGAVVPALNAGNVPGHDAAAQAVRRVVERLGARSRRIALVIPDSAAKVSILRLETVPGRLRDLDQLIRWHVRKAAPFRIEDAQVTYARGAAGEGGAQEFVVAVARRDVVQEYERVCLAAGVAVGLVDLSTFGLANAVLAGSSPPAGDWLLVNVTPEYSTMGILRGADLIFFRNRAEGGDGNLADLVHQTAMYYQDRLSGQGFQRVVLSGSPETAGGPAAASAGLDQIRRDLEARLGVRVEALDSRALARFADRITVDAALVQTVAPLVGVLLRERPAA